MPDSMQEMMAAAARQKREEIERLSAKLAETGDADVREALLLKIEQLRQQLAAAERASGANAAPQTPLQTAQPTAPESAEATRLKGPSRAALEAQVRELQVELLERARAAEIASLPGAQEKLKLAETREKLQNAMRALAEAAKREAAEVAASLPAKPTPQQQSEADSLLRQANVARMRGQKQLAVQLLQRAAAAAPGSAAVLEALGDDLAAQGRSKEALDTYAQALAIQPGNASVERKYGSMIVRARGAMTAEQILAMGDSGLVTADAASRKAAVLMSMILPGLGQIVMGQTAKGATFMGAWLAMLALAFWLPDGVRNLIVAASGVGAQLNPLVVVCLLVALGLHIAAIASIGKVGGREPVQRPRPPVDLPYE